MRTIIVGGVAGGMSAATRLRRLHEDAEIMVYERGGDVSYANCGLPYYVGQVIHDRGDLLLQTPSALAARFRLDVRVLHEVVSINAAEHTVQVRNLVTRETFTDHYDHLILSTGATPIVPDIPGSERCLTLRDVADTDAMKQRVDHLVANSGSAVVIGGGFIGVELAENLRERGVPVTLVELAPQILTPLDPEMASYAADELLAHGTALRLGTSVTSIAEDHVETSEGERIPAQMVAACIGVRPEVTLAREAGMELGELGGIAVDECLRTSLPDVYAVGDAVEKHRPGGAGRTLIPLANIANRQGRAAADAISGHPVRPTAAQGTGTAVVKVHSLTVASVGVNERALQRQQRAYTVAHAHPPSHAGYYPGAQTVHLKLLFDPHDGTILGTQGVGTEGVARRIDVIATAMAGGLTATDLIDLELAYAPPFGSAKDPVNQLGYISENVLTGQDRLISWEHLDTERDAGNAVVIDVRTPEEFAEGNVPGSLNIPVDELRERHREITVQSSERLVVLCRVGQRGHVASQVLRGLGYTAENLSGGYLTWEAGQRARALAQKQDLAPTR